MSVFQYEEIPGTLEHINELMVEKEVRQPSVHGLGSRYKYILI
jgi:hypothetical protein